MSAVHCLQSMWAGVGTILFLLIVASVVGRRPTKHPSAQIGQSPKKGLLRMAWISVGLFVFFILLASSAEWRLEDVRLSEATIHVNENENTHASKQAHKSIKQSHPVAFNSEFEPNRQESAASSPGLQASQGPKLAAHFEPATNERASVDFLANPDVVEVQEKLLKTAKRQSESEYESVHDLIRQVRIPGNLAGVGWVAIDRQTTMLSTESLGAYHRWRKAILDATPAKYSLQDIEGTTSGPAEFRSEQALKAKTHLLNIAAQMGPSDSKLVAAAIKGVERDGTAWIISDHLMDKVQLDTSVAYQRWKNAVWSESEPSRSK